MRILVLINELDVGGAERLVVDQVNTDEEVEFDICVLGGVGSLATAVPRHIQVHDLGCAPWDARALSRLRELIKGVKPDLVHAHLPRAGALAGLARRLDGGLVLYTAHNVWGAYRIRSRPLVFVAARLSDRVVAVSDQVRASMLAHTGVPAHRIVTVRNGIDTARISSATPSLVRGRLSVCAVGNLRPQKGYGYLLRAVADLPRDVTITVDVFGGGPEHDKLARTAADLGVADKVIFRGPVADAAKLLVGYDAFVMPSVFEGLPMALIEAMAARLPIVATTAGGIPEIITNRKNGLLVPPANPSALTAALIELARNPDLRAELATAAMQTAREECTMSVAATAYRRLYLEMIHGHRGDQPPVASA